MNKKSFFHYFFGKYGLVKISFTENIYNNMLVPVALSSQNVNISS